MYFEKAKQTKQITIVAGRIYYFPKSRNVFNIAIFILNIYYSEVLLGNSNEIYYNKDFFALPRQKKHGVNQDIASESWPDYTTFKNSPIDFETGMSCLTYELII